MSEWGDFGACSETCGGGTKVRERTVIQAATGGGTACPELTNTVDCNTGPCTTGKGAPGRVSLHSLP